MIDTRVELVSATGVAYSAGMTPNPAPDPQPATPPRSGGDRPRAGFGVAPDGTAGTIAARLDREQFRAALAGVVYFIARCARCGDGDGDPMVQPFRDETERDEWAAQHVTGTGHVVTLTIDGLEGLPQLHMVGVLTRDEHGQYRFVCPADDCGTSNGPYDRALTAIASWRTHKPFTPATAGAR